jgi:hypothetical protein
VANRGAVDTPMLQSALGEVKQAFAHIQEPSWMEWGSLILALPPQNVANDHESQDRVQKEAELLTKLIDGAISQSEYEQQIGESGKDVAGERSDSSAVEFVAPGSADRDGSQAEGQSEGVSLGQESATARPTPRSKRKANDSPIRDTTASASSILIKKKLPMAVMTPTYVAEMRTRTVKSSAKSSAKSGDDVEDYPAPVGRVCGLALHDRPSF